MNENFFDKCYGLINYETYKKIYEYILLIGTLSGVAFMPLLNANVFSPHLLISFILSRLYCDLCDQKILEEKTRDVKDIKQIYDILIKNYANLNNQFNLHDPQEIYKMFVTLLNNGYLSYNKKFEYSFDNVCDIQSLKGSNILKGNGVCRHISSMLNDVYNTIGIESYVLPVYQREWDSKLIFLDSNLSEEEKEKININLYKFVNFDDLVEFINKNYYQRIIVEKQFLETELSKNLISNHVINMIIYNNHKYFLDPTQERIYNYSLEENNLYDNFDSLIKVYPKNFKIYNRNLKFKNVKPKFLLKTAEYEDDIVLTSRIISLIKDNLDIFEIFYKNNRVIYEEISEKLNKIRTRH